MLYSETTSLRKIARLTKKIRVVQGGTSASKTISILQLLITLSQTDTSPKLTSIVSESLPHLKKGAIRDFKSIMKSHNYWKEDRWHDTDKTYTFETGSQIEFFGAEQSEKLRGGRRDRGFMNECNTLSLDAFDEFEVRTREFVFLDFNPTNEFWVFTDVLGQRNDVELIILTYKDNEACPPEIVNSIEQRRNRKGWYQVYGLGQLGEIEGLIYKGWRVIDEVPPGARLERRWLDFGYTNDPSASGDVWYFNNEWILDENFYLKGMSNKQVADTFLAMPRKETVIVADSAEPKSIDELRSYGLNVMPCEKGKDSVTNGIQMIQDQPIAVTRRSVNLLKEQRNYLWLVDKNGKTLNTPDPTCEDHHMDGVRYALQTLGKLQQAKDYWDRIYEKELNPQDEALPNMGR